MNWGHAGVLYSLTPGLIDGFFNILHYSLRLGDLVFCEVWFAESAGRFAGTAGVGLTRLSELRFFV